MRIANGSFGSNNGQPWAAHLAQARRRREDSKNENLAGTSSPEALLTPEKIREFLDAYLCPWCGAGPFKVVALHVSASHGIGRIELRDAAGLARSSKITPKDYSERLADASRDRLSEMSAKGRAALREKYGAAHQSIAAAGRIKQMKTGRDALAPKALELMSEDKPLAEVAEALSISLPRLRAILDENGMEYDLRARGARLRGTPEAANEWLRKNWRSTEARLREGAKRKASRDRQQFISRYDEVGHSEEGLNLLASEYGVQRKAVIARLKKYGCDVPDLRGRSVSAKSAQERRRGRPKCSIVGCENLHAARGMCDTHYRQWKKREEQYE